MASSFVPRFRAAWTKAKHWMEYHPLATNSVLTLNLWIAGDVLAQKSEQKDKPTFTWDSVRTAQCAGYGGFVTGPLFAIWYPWLDRISKQYQLAARYGPWGPPIAKVIADELIMDPPCIFMFLGYMTLCEGNGFDTFVGKLSHEFWNIWIASFVVWPPVLLGTFRYLPVYAQAPVINAVCVVWDAFLSHRNQESKHTIELSERVTTDGEHQDEPRTEVPTEAVSPRMSKT